MLKVSCFEMLMLIIHPPKLLKECLSFIDTLTRNYTQNYLYWHTWLIHLMTLPYFQNVLCESCAEKVEFALSCYVWIKVGASFQLHYWNMNFCLGFNMYCVNHTPSTTKMIVYIRILFKLMCTNWNLLGLYIDASVHTWEILWNIERQMAWFKLFCHIINMITRKPNHVFIYFPQHK